MNIILIGYMGSGKSTIALELSNLLDFSFVDFDSYIEEKEGIDISSIFKLKGEIYFRKKESLYLAEVLENKGSMILALGGGTPCYGENMNRIVNNQNSVTFYLKVSIPELTSRLIYEKDKRPLISHIESKEELAEFIGKHLFERIQFYNKSDYTINTDNKSSKDIVNEIVAKLI